MTTPTDAPAVDHDEAMRIAGSVLEVREHLPHYPKSRRPSPSDEQPRNAESKDDQNCDDCWQMARMARCSKHTIVSSPAPADEQERYKVNYCKGCDGFGFLPSAGPIDDHVTCPTCKGDPNYLAADEREFEK